MKGANEVTMLQGVVTGECSFCKATALCTRMYFQNICERCADLAVKMIRSSYAVSADKS